MKLQTKRVYDDPESSDGVRILVDRLWPRGLSKDKARLDHWMREVAPSDELRRWFGHDPNRWEAFRERYFHELDDAPDARDALRRAIGRGPATLVFAARDQTHNHAEALRVYLMQSRGSGAG